MDRPSRTSKYNGRRSHYFFVRIRRNDCVPNVHFLNSKDCAGFAWIFLHIFWRSGSMLSWRQRSMFADIKTEYHTWSMIGVVMFELKCNANKRKIAFRATIFGFFVVNDNFTVFHIGCWKFFQWFYYVLYIFRGYFGINNEQSLIE